MSGRTAVDGRRPASSLDEGHRYECGFCGERFTEDRGQPACRSCPLAEACRYVRCPHCSYENPVTPGWVDRLRGLWPGTAGRGVR